MKTLKRILGIAALTAVITTTSAQSWLTNGLVAYYPFNGNGNDESGNGNNGQLTGNVQLTTNRFGHLASAYRFDGSQGSIDVTNAVFNIGQPEYTLAGWFSSDDVSKSHQCLFNSIPHTGIGLIYNHNYAPGYVATFIGPADAFWTVLAVHGPKSDYANRTWYHWAFVKSGITYKFYVNGALDYQTDVSAAAGYNYGVGYRFGAIDPGTGSEVFKGTLDDVRIYNRALSTNELAQLYILEDFCSPHRAKATVTLSGDGLGGATMVDYGCGYTNVPSVRIVGGGGSGATAIANIANGIVTDLVITSPGSGYTNAPRILIESPPFVPTVAIAISKVKVTQQVRVNHNYVLEATLDLVTWTATGPAFTAEAESIVNEFDVDTVGRYFRLREVP